jgi:mercuric ion transport protein
MCCRLYKDGAPSIDQIRARLRADPTAHERGRVRLSIVGGVAAALAASACCLVPALLAIVGVSGAGVASTLAPWRPYFLGAAGLAIAAGFWFAYRREPADACGCATPRSRRWSRLALWISTVAILGIASYPLVFDAHASVAAHERGVAEVRLHVTGMDCAACTKIVTHDGKRDLTKDLLDAVEDLGYEATVVKPDARSTR